jgi:hypothetical protein
LLLGESFEDVMGRDLLADYLIICPFIVNSAGFNEFLHWPGFPLDRCLLYCYFNLASADIFSSFEDFRIVL